MARTALLAVLGLIILLTATGCTSTNAYQAIDLDEDLSPETLARYEAEYEAMDHSTMDHSGPVVLEKTNWWPLGLIAYYRRGSVMRVPNENGPGYQYTVMHGYGIGPLSVLYSLGESATYDSEGKRLSGMAMSTVLLGHLAMAHSGDSLLESGEEETSTSLHLLHHIFALHKMNDHTYVSLFTVPNAIGGTLGHGH